MSGSLRSGRELVGSLKNLRDGLSDVIAELDALCDQSYFDIKRLEERLRDRGGEVCGDGLPDSEDAS